MARVITNVKDFETWKSNIEGTLFVKRFDRRGDEVDERVDAGREIRLLPEERRLNQEIAATASLDPFQNGMLVPLKLVETAEDYEDLRGYPNHLTEDDMRGLLADRKDLDGLREGIQTVSNPTTLVRFLAIAEEEDVDASMRQVAVLRERLAEVSSQGDYFEDTGTATTSDGREIVISNAPVSPAPTNPGMGRR